MLPIELIIFIPTVSSTDRHINNVAHFHDAMSDLIFDLLSESANGRELFPKIVVRNEFGEVSDHIESKRSSVPHPNNWGVLLRVALLVRRCRQQMELSGFVAQGLSGCSLECSVAGPVGLWARGARVWAGGGQRASVVHGLSTRPAGFAPVRRTRPQFHRTLTAPQRYGHGAHAPRRGHRPPGSHRTRTRRACAARGTPPSARRGSGAPAPAP